MPSLPLNWVDWIILIFLFIYSLIGIKRGFLALLGEMVSFIASFLISLRFYGELSKFLIGHFQFPLNISRAFSFIILALFAETVIVLIITIFYRQLPQKIFHSLLNKLLGFIPALFDGLVITAFILTVTLSLPLPQPLKNDLFNSRLSNILIQETRGVEKTLNLIFGGAVEDTLNFLTIKPNSYTSIDLRFSTSNISPDESSELSMLSLVNTERQNRLLPPLKPDSKLRSLARTHSSDMFLRGYFSHINPAGQDPFNRMREAGILYTSAGENLAFAQNVAIAHRGLMDSPEHRGNILNPQFRKIGIGVINGGIYGEMFTQEFTD